MSAANGFIARSLLKRFGGPSVALRRPACATQIGLRVAQAESSYFAIVGFTQPACITLCDGRKLK